MIHESRATSAGGPQGWRSPRGANVRTAVILSAAKDLSPGRAQILRCAQDDRWWAGRPHGRSLPHVNTDTFRLTFVPLGASPALVNALMTYVLICMLALLITSCNWPGAQQTRQPDARLQSFHVLSTRIIILDTQAEVDGTLQNISHTDRFPYDVTVIATFYNRAGNVVGQAGGVAEDVYPGMTRPFILAGSVDSTQYSHMVVTVVSLKERRIEKIIPTPSVVP
jgi:hypothetical protein